MKTRAYPKRDAITQAIAAMATTAVPVQSAESAILPDLEAGAAVDLIPRGCAAATTA